MTERGKREMKETERDKEIQTYRQTDIQRGVSQADRECAERERGERNEGRVRT